MNKLSVLFLLASVIALSWAFPKEDTPGGGHIPQVKKRNKVMAEAFMKKRTNCSPSAVAALKHYGLDASMCGQSKRVDNDFSRLLRRRELEYDVSKARYARSGFNACCSPDCDWLLNYLEIDSTVVKCIDRK